MIGRDFRRASTHLFVSARPSEGRRDEETQPTAAAWRPRSTSSAGSGSRSCSGISRRGPRRFGELRRLVTGISEKMLIQQLREMEADGIVARKDFREIPPRVEYSLTAFGVSLSEALRPLCDWGREHMSRIEKAKAEVG